MDIMEMLFKERESLMKEEDPESKTFRKPPKVEPSSCAIHRMRKRKVDRAEKGEESVSGLLVEMGCLPSASEKGTPPPMPPPAQNNAAAVRSPRNKEKEREVVGGQSPPLEGGSVGSSDQLGHHDSRVLSTFDVLERLEAEAGAIDTDDESAAHQQRMAKQRIAIQRQKSQLKYEQSRDGFLSMSVWSTVALVHTRVSRGAAFISPQGGDESDFISGGAFVHLPCELIMMIFNHLGLSDIATVARVCRGWGLWAGDERIWKRIFLRDHGEPTEDELFASWRRDELSWHRLCKQRILHNRRAKIHQEQREKGHNRKAANCNFCQEMSAVEETYQRNLDILVCSKCSKCGHSTVESSSFDKAMWFARG